MNHLFVRGFGGWYAAVLRATMACVCIVLAACGGGGGAPAPIPIPAPLPPGITLQPVNLSVTEG